MRIPPLPMLCTIARPDATARDAFGQPTAATTVASSVPCYWWSGESAWTLRTGMGQTAVDQEHVIFAIGQDVRQGDWVTALTDQEGREVFSAADYRVIHGVGMMRNHLDCTLRYGEAIGGRA